MTAFATRRASRWEDDLQTRDVSCVAVDHTWAEFLYDIPDSLAPSMTNQFDVPGVGLVEHTGAPIDLSATPAHLGALEVLGESTRRVLLEAKLSPSEITDLAAAGVIAVHPDGAAT